MIKFCGCNNGQRIMRKTGGTIEYMAQLNSAGADYQNARYGEGRRVVNPSQKMGEKDKGVCTVCGRQVGNTPKK